MRLLIDTTYLLPAIGVSIRGFPRTAVQDLQREGHTLSICTITIFELAAKGAKFVASRRLKHRRVEDGLRAILHDPRIGQVPYQEPHILSRALAVREEIGDFIDCLILSSAAAQAEALVTEDEQLQHLFSRESIKAKLRPVTPTFSVCPSRKISKLA